MVGHDDFDMTSCTRREFGLSMAGAGATIGKMHRGRGYTGMKGGLGTASLKLGDLIIGALAADLLADAIVRGVRAARSVDGWPAVRDIG